jgi:endonuclease YncB( thermonuclease family)
MIRTALICILVLAVWFVSAPSWAADRKAWVRLADCQYVEQTYNDGDSVHVQCGAQEFIVRLYFVDAPEPTLRYPDRTREQSEYFGVTLDETLRAGRHATHLVRERLRTPFVVWTRWASAAGRTKTPRYYGVVEVEGQNLAELLVREGLARTKGAMATGPTGEPARVVQERLQALERTARQHKRGVWATSTAGPTAQATP